MIDVAGMGRGQPAVAPAVERLGDRVDAHGTLDHVRVPCTVRGGSGGAEEK